ncbi:putative signal peptide protein [Puccinia sorghi]|uniref:Putative signal peptide protein n=1 Tax=Puccinia sorghi TaxID=27349 RepID=A0A0L6URY3_9BASI|nr:putative signal peptide protein [Puccinia sorghi]
MGEVPNTIRYRFFVLRKLLLGSCFQCKLARFEVFSDGICS